MLESVLMAQTPNLKYPTHLEQVELADLVKEGEIGSADCGISSSMCFDFTAIEHGNSLVAMNQQAMANVNHPGTNPGAFTFSRA